MLIRRVNKAYRASSTPVNKRLRFGLPLQLHITNWLSCVYRKTIRVKIEWPLTKSSFQRWALMSLLFRTAEKTGGRYDFGKQQPGRTSAAMFKHLVRQNAWKIFEKSTGRAVFVLPVGVLSVCVQCIGWAEVWAWVRRPNEDRECNDYIVLACRHRINTIVLAMLYSTSHIHATFVPMLQNRYHSLALFWNLSVFVWCHCDLTRSGLLYLVVCCMGQVLTFSGVNWKYVFLFGEFLEPGLLIEPVQLRETGTQSLTPLAMTNPIRKILSTLIMIIKCWLWVSLSHFVSSQTSMGDPELVWPVWVIKAQRLYRTTMCWFMGMINKVKFNNRLPSRPEVRSGADSLSSSAFALDLLVTSQ